MDRIFAPWRMEWIARDTDTDDGCVFCSLPEEQNDRENRILARSDNAYALLNKSPYTPGHLLVLPFSHDGTLEAADENCIVEIFRLVRLSAKAINRALHPDGLNVGMNIGEAGGASIEDHLHVHIVPRWTGDTTFMPTTTNSKVIAEALDETYARLYAAFTKLDRVEGTSSDAAAEVRN